MCFLEHCVIWCKISWIIFCFWTYLSNWQNDGLPWGSLEYSPDVLKVLWKLPYCHRVPMSHYIVWACTTVLLLNFKGNLTKIELNFKYSFFIWKCIILIKKSFVTFTLKTIKLFTVTYFTVAQVLSISWAEVKLQ